MEMLKSLLRIVLLVLAASLPFVACDASFTGSDNGRLSILLTDMPAEVQDATVTITEVYLQAGPGENEPRLHLLDEEFTTNLLELSNDAVELVENANVPAGSYAQLRLVISGGYLEVAEEEDGPTLIFASSPEYAETHHPDGRSADGFLQMPGFAQTGIKVNLRAGALQVNGGDNVVLVDFDVAESFGQEAGMSGMWVMEPVINAVDFDLAASITVSLALGDGVELPGDVSLANFAAHLADESGNTKEDGFVESNGVYTASFRYLLPDRSWVLSLDVPEGVSVETDPGPTIDPDTAAGADIEVDLTITVAEEDDSDDS